MVAVQVGARIQNRNGGIFTVSNKQFKPMRAAKMRKAEDVIYPVFSSPKIDGFRVVVIGGTVLSNNLLPIPNVHVQEMFGHRGLNGLDGELIVGSPTAKNVLSNTSHIVSSNSNHSDELKFFLFDDFTYPDDPYIERKRRLESRIPRTSNILHLVRQSMCVNAHCLDLQYELAMKEGYEGTMIRSPTGRYKFGRSTIREGLLVKRKGNPDEDESEAIIIDFIEQTENQNEERTGGIANRRSSKKAGKVGTGKLGSFVCRRPSDGQEFQIGTGLSDRQREEFWAIRDRLLGEHLTYRSFRYGEKDRPRHSVFCHLRPGFDVPV